MQGSAHTVTLFINRVLFMNELQVLSSIEADDF